MNYYYQKRRDYPGDYFPVPKAIFRMGLNAGEIAVLAYLMYCEDRRTYQCHPSYATIGEACNMSVNTVRKHVHGLVLKGFIYKETTTITTQDGRKRNGTLQYTLKPMREVEEEYKQEQLRIAEQHVRWKKAIKKYGGVHFEKVNL